jgi:hypothetical protein
MVYEGDGDSEESPACEFYCPRKHRMARDVTSLDRSLREGEDFWKQQADERVIVSLTTGVVGSPAWPTTPSSRLSLQRSGRLEDEVMSK